LGNAFDHASPVQSRGKPGYVRRGHPTRRAVGFEEEKEFHRCQKRKCSPEGEHLR
jgi:hypothetical protein